MSQTRDNVRAQARRMRGELGVVSTDLERLIRRRRMHRRPRATVPERHHLVELRGSA